MNALQVNQVAVPGRLKGVSLALPSGVLAGLVGPNGAGKSTLLQICAGLLPCEGSVEWSGRPLASIPVLERGRLATWVPQEARFEFGFTVRSVVAQGRFAHGDDELGVDSAIDRLELGTLRNRPVTQLSGGERQRVLLARALVTRAQLHFWDEPLAALDPRHALDALRLGKELTKQGATMLFSLHDLRLAYCLDYVAVLHEGRLAAAGKPEEVLTPDLLWTVFGVRARTGPGMILEIPSDDELP
jgi:iron complex transport system ATP-binding protein